MSDSAKLILHKLLSTDFSRIILCKLINSQPRCRESTFTDGKKRKVKKRNKTVFIQNIPIKEKTERLLKENLSNVNDYTEHTKHSKISFVRGIFQIIISNILIVFCY